MFNFSPVRAINNSWGCRDCDDYSFENQEKVLILQVVSGRDSLDLCRWDSHPVLRVISNNINL